MSDLDAIGGAATGGLIASAVEKPSGHAGETHHVCTDCGSTTVGRFCHNCGQPTHVHRTLLHLGEELLHGVMHFDSRAWRTLPLLVFRPGRLTREWVHGKRTRYVSPLAMFLFTVFVMFMVLSFLPAAPEQSLADRQISAGLQVAEERTRLANAEAALRTATPQMREDAQEKVVEARSEVRAAVAEFEGLRKARAAGVTTGDWKAKLSSDAKSGRLNINVGDDEFDKKILKKLENPELALYKLQQTFYKFSFLLVPLSIPFVAALFLWKRGFTLYDHGVFVLYSLTFVSMLVMAIAFTARLGGNWTSLAGVVAPLVVPFHMYYQLKGAYDLRPFSALWRTAFLLVFCNVVLLLFFLAVIWLGLA